MQETFSKVEDLVVHVKEYIDNRIASVKLSAAEKSSRLLANTIAVAVSLIIFVFFIVFAGISAAYAFAKLTGEYYWGFLIVAGIYLLIGIIVWLSREKILRLPIMNAMLRQLFKEEEELDADNNDEN